MKRDLSQMRALLLEVEVAPGPMTVSAGTSDEARSRFYQLELMEQAGYVDSTNLSTMDEGRKVVFLTWKGLEVLDAIRSDATWALLREKLPIDRSEVPFHIVERYAFHLAAQQAQGMGP